MCRKRTAVHRGRRAKQHQIGLHINSIKCNSNWYRNLFRSPNEWLRFGGVASGGSQSWAICVSDGEFLVVSWHGKVWQVTSICFQGCSLVVVTARAQISNSFICIWGSNPIWIQSMQFESMLTYSLNYERLWCDSAASHLAVQSPENMLVRNTRWIFF